MYRYRIETGGYGGELTIGEVTPEFLEYFRNHEDHDDLIFTLDDPVDDNQPYALPEADYHTAWYEISEMMHMTGPYADNHYTVILLDDDGNEVRDIGTYPYSVVYGQECYTSTDADVSETVTGDKFEWKPVLTCHSSEKGGFGTVDIETAEPFDPTLFGVTVVESNMCELISEYYYDGEELEVNFDWADSMGKAFYSEVGYANQFFETNMHESTLKWKDESVVEFFDPDCIAYRREEV